MGPDEALRLHIFIDASTLEIFTGTGHTLTTRVYRGHPPPNGMNPKIHVLSPNGGCTVEALDAWELSHGWLSDADAPCT